MNYGQVPVFGGSSISKLANLQTPIYDVYQYKAFDQMCQRPYTDKVLGLKAAPVARPTSFPSLVGKNEGIRAHQGIGRHDDKGLGYDPDYDRSGPLLKQPDNQYGMLNSTIPLPP